MADGDKSMEVNRNVQLNWGTFNVPTITLCLAIAGMVYNMGGKQASTDTRIDSLETQRAIRSAEVNKVLEALQTKVSPIDNLTYRVTSAENSISDVNRRVDRIGDSMSLGFENVRKDISSLSEKLAVMDSKLRVVPDSPPKLDR
jgi:hypothetical protein